MLKKSKNTAAHEMGNMMIRSGLVNFLLSNQSCKHNAIKYIHNKSDLKKMSI